jgi:hypothetical protein
MEAMTFDPFRCSVSNRMASIHSMFHNCDAVQIVVSPSSIRNQIVKCFIDIQCWYFGIAMGYRLDGQGIGVRFLAGEINCSLLHGGQTAYPVGIEGYYSGVKQPGREADSHLHLMPRLRIRGAIPLFSHTSSWRGS